MILVEIACAYCLLWRTFIWGGGLSVSIWMPVDFVALIGRIENVWLAYGWIVAKLRAESSEFSVGNMRYTTYRIVQHEDYWRII